MIKNFDANILDVSGKEILENGNPTPLKRIVVDALYSSAPDDVHINGEEKLKRALLAKKIFKGGDIEITTDDLIMIKKLCGERCSTLAYSQIHDVLES